MDTHMVICMIQGRWGEEIIDSIKALFSDFLCKFAKYVADLKHSSIIIS
jgi:hypothetical protein